MAASERRGKVGARLSFPDEAEIEADQKENEVRDRAQPVYLRLYDEIRAEDGDRCVGEVEIEKYAGTDEERPSQEFADFFPVYSHAGSIALDVEVVMSAVAALREPGVRPPGAR